MTTSHAPSHRPRRRRSRMRRGFTLLEMLIAISLMSAGVPGRHVPAGLVGPLDGADAGPDLRDGRRRQQHPGRHQPDARGAGLLPARQPDDGPAETGWIAPKRHDAGPVRGDVERPDGPHGDRDHRAARPRPSRQRLQARHPDHPRPVHVGRLLATSPPYSSQTAGTAVTPDLPGRPRRHAGRGPDRQRRHGRGDLPVAVRPPAGRHVQSGAAPADRLCKTLSLSPNAVQFVRPTYAGVPEPNQVEIKIISGYYSPINGQQTNEEGNGASSSQFVGKCVYMRDHQPGATAAGGRTDQQHALPVPLSPALHSEDGTGHRQGKTKCDARQR